MPQKLKLAISDGLDSPESKLKAYRWFWVACVCLFLNIIYTLSITHYLDRISEIGLSHSTDGNTQPKIGLAVAADGRTWERLINEQTQTLQPSPSHYTYSDNFPVGRPVHWSSLWSNYQSSFAQLRMMFTQEDLPSALSITARWSNLLIWALTVLFLGHWIAKRWGSSAAIVLCLGMLGHRGIFLSYFPAYPDHHGLITSCILGLLLGALGMGLGWLGSGNRWLPEKDSLAKQAAILSAISGGIGLAVSAASLIPVIILIGIIGALGYIMWPEKKEIQETIKPNASLWRLWGAVGCITSLFLYFLEYYPVPFTLRLEVNHPVYALAWLGGAELLARLAEWKQRNPSLASTIRTIIAFVLLVLPLALFYYYGSTVFLPADPFLSKVHAEISEFRPLWQEGLSYKLLFLITLLPLSLVFIKLRNAESASSNRIPLCFMLVTVATSILALYQQRWWMLAGAAQVIQAILLTVQFQNYSRKVYIGWMSLVCLMYLPGFLILARERLVVERINDVQTGEAMQLLYRDVASLINTRHPNSKIALLAAPNASVSIGYYGNIATLGTLYWENKKGLYAAANILTAESNETAETLLKQRGITHLVMVTPEDFTVEYMKALDIPLTNERIRQSFGRRLMTGENIPNWLQAIPYQVPSTYSRIQAKVYIYETNWNLSASESQWALGLARILSGEEKLGRDSLAASAKAGKAEAGIVLAWRLATAPMPYLRDGKAAVVWAESSLRLLVESAENRRVLAAAYAAAGRWTDAQAACLFAINLAKEENNEAIAKQLESDFTRYQNKQAFP